MERPCCDIMLVTLHATCPLTSLAFLCNPSIKQMLGKMVKSYKLIPVPSCLLLLQLSNRLTAAAYQALSWLWVCCAGPGLAVRVLGDVTEGNALDVLRHVDEVYIQTIRDYGLYDQIWQAFAVFLPVRQVALSKYVLAVEHYTLNPRRPQKHFCCRNLNPKIYFVYTAELCMFSFQVTAHATDGHRLTWQLYLCCLFLTALMYHALLSSQITRAQQSKMAATPECPDLA